MCDLRSSPGRAAEAAAAVVNLRQALIFGFVPDLLVELGWPDVDNRIIAAVDAREAGFLPG
jgi:hypothetical protein